ncbi:Outer membrane protein (porin) [Succinivibrio dextrinosolvens]|uniref:porin n=1 Tax=Succinivibrio dextrinosolvens TaxID=83771 RepID=UPI0008E0EE61|nr:porin [Succinivibrio dextrinosolvens]SFS37584.1 Outer membrane protein (porin) [Succinivibrio dextrinosolvens]
MKKTLLGIAIITSGLYANAATVYDKDDTTLEIGGRVQSVLYNTKYNQAGDHDASIVNSSRFSLSGRTRINDYVSGFAFAEWEMANGKDGISAREQYVGADFEDFGRLYAGKTYDAVKHVILATDIFEDFGGLAQPESDDFRNGILKYEYDNHGFYASASLQTAADNQKVYGEPDDDEDIEMNVDSGFALSAGYTIEDVVFGPLSFNLGYSYTRLQNDKEKRVIADPDSGTALDNGRNIAASISWGSTDEGLYIAALYTDKKWNFSNNILGYTRGYEIVGGYTFENGIGIYTGFENLYNTMDDGYGKQPNKIDRRIPVYVNFNANENFNVWAEARFNAGSTPEFGGMKFHEETGSVFSVGARYTF